MHEQYRKFVLLPADVWLWHYMQMSTLALYYGGFTQIFSDTHFLTPDLKRWKLTSWRRENGNLLKSKDPWDKKPSLLNERLYLGIMSFPRFLWFAPLSASLSLSAKYFGFEVCTILWTINRIFFAISCCIDRLFALSSSVAVGVSIGKPVWSLITVFCNTCNFLLSSFVNETYLLSLSL